MKLDRVKLNRKYNLGNYETLDVGFETETTEQDNPLDVLKRLENIAEMYLQTRLSKAEEKPAAAPKPVVTPPTSPPHIPDFDSQELLTHKWKGRKLNNGEYADGSLGWGWNFRDQFSKAVIAVLEKGAIVIDQYEFTLTENLVSAKKKKT